VIIFVFAETKRINYYDFIILHNKIIIILNSIQNILFSIFLTFQLLGVNSYIIIQ
jgi:hypothetical protein